MKASEQETVLIYGDLSYRIMNAVYEVHNQLGPGFPEDIYQQALKRELKERNIPFEEQKVISVFYKGEQIGTYRLDLIIDNRIILELKAATDMQEIFKRQLLSYVKATGMRLGILINFGTLRVQHHRIVN